MTLLTATPRGAGMLFSFDLACLSTRRDAYLGLYMTEVGSLRN